MIVTLPADAAEQLAELACLEAERHPPQTPERRAAAHLWAALITTTTIDAARRALGTFGDERTQSGALDLLGRLAAELAASPEGHS